MLSLCYTVQLLEIDSASEAGTLPSACALQINDTSSITNTHPADRVMNAAFTMAVSVAEVSKLQSACALGQFQADSVMNATLTLAMVREAEDTRCCQLLLRSKVKQR